MTRTNDKTEPVDGVTVGTSRRILFTTLSIAMLAAVTYQSYWHACDIGFFRGSPSFRPMPGEITVTNPSWGPLHPAGTMALAPTLLLAISVANSPTRAARQWWLLVAAVFFCLTIYGAEQLGLEDAQPTIDRVWDTAPPMHLPIFRDWKVMHVPTFRDWHNSTLSPTGTKLTIMRSHHIVSWLRLLLPFTLTSAFVIYAAERQAARDAMIEAAGEDE